MIKRQLQVFFIKRTMGANRMIYGLHKVPLLKRLIPDSLYRQVTVKRVLGILSLLLAGMGKILKKFLFLFFLLWAPLTFLWGEETGGEAYLLQMWFVLSFVGGSLNFIMSSGYDEQDLVMLEQFRMAPAPYICGKIFTQRGMDLLAMLPATLVLSSMGAFSFRQGLLLLVVRLCFQLVGEATFLLIYRVTKINYVVKGWYGAPMILATLVAAYLPVYLRSCWPLVPFLLHPATIAISLLAAFLSCWAIWSSRGFDLLARQGAERLRQGLEESQQAEKTVRFADVEIKEKQVDLQKEDDRRVKGKRGFSYLNAMFFLRHKKVVYKQVRQRCTLVAIGAVVLCGVLLFLPEQREMLLTQLLTNLTLYFWVLYAVSIGEPINRMLFCSCDVHMLHYPFYRTPQAIWENFRARVWTSMRYNLTIGLVIYGVIVLWGIFFRAPVAPYSYLLLLIAVLGLSFFFSYHYLFVYYLLQPYTTDYGSKNIWYSIANSAVYILCYVMTVGLWDAHIPGTVLAIGIAVVAGLYYFVGQILVRRFAPKTFHLK